jgi:predicted amidohydrolase YtcJ
MNPASADPIRSADPVVLRGRVLPLKDNGPKEVEGAAIDRGRISSVGSGGELATPAGAAEVDFGDRVVLPAFVDPHAHLEITSVARYSMADCRAPSHKNIGEALEALSEKARETEKGEWVMGEANLFFDQKIEDKRLPTRKELDSVTTDHPMILRAGGHTSVLNTQALEITDVTKYIGKQGMMGGAVVHLGDDGEPTGVISELDKALGLPTLDHDQLRAALEQGIDNLFLQYGVTAVGEISETREGLAILDDLIGSGQAPIRLAVYLWAPGTCTVEEACEWPPFSAPRGDMRVSGLKMFADGGYSARNAAARTPYLNRDGSESHMGKINLSVEEIADAMRRTQAAGIQLAVHGNGELAQDQICNGILASGIEDPIVPRIEHAGNVLTEFGATDLWKRAGITPMPQPVFLYNFGEGLTTYLGPAVAKGRYPFRSLLDAGWRISGSSDCHLGCEESQTNPMFSIWCCVARRGFWGEEIQPDQTISVTEALRMHTLYAAEAIREEDERGSLETGKRGDVIVLDRDPREVAADELPDVKVDFVYVDGRQVHAREGARPAAIKEVTG